MSSHTPDLPTPTERETVTETDRQTEAEMRRRRHLLQGRRSQRDRHTDTDGQTGNQN